MIRAAVLAFLIAFSAAPAAPATADQVFDLGAKAPVPGDKSWRDLLSQIFPDLRQETDAKGKAGDYIHGKLDIRPIDTEAFEDNCPDTPLRVEYVDFAQVQIAGKMRLIVGVTTDGDACVGALALFDGTGESKLLDVVNIQQDANYAFGANFVRSLGSDAQLVVADSFHTTTSSSPDNDLLVLATRDRLSLIGNLDARSVHDCHRAITEDGYIAIWPDYGPFDRITGYIKRIVRRLAPDCETPQGTPSVTITRTDWRWDTSKKAYRKVSP